MRWFPLLISWVDSPVPQRFPLHAHLNRKPEKILLPAFFGSHEKSRTKRPLPPTGNEMVLIIKNHPCDPSLNKKDATS
jgi:hypothetical protein